jgi:hypothetical protein
MNNSTLKWFVKETTWLDRSIINCGWGNGYVCIPENHPCFGLTYDKIHELYEISVNGGLNYCKHSNDLKDWPEIPEGEWWVVGFDTVHFWNKIESWPKERVEQEAQILLVQLSMLTRVPEDPSKPIEFILSNN